MPHLFKKFFRVHETEAKIIGTGLGLSITKQIVLGHRGTIDVKSKSGKGTTFIIHLPLKAHRETNEHHHEEDAVEKTYNGGKVLL